MPLSEENRKNLWLPLVLRLALAAIFVFHGLEKIAGNDPVTHRSNDWGAAWADNLWERLAMPPAGVDRNIEHLIEDGKVSRVEGNRVRDELHIVYRADHKDPANQLPGFLAFAGVQILVAWGELVCGLALLVGMFTRLSALLMILIQIGAIATVTWAHGFAPPQGYGFEYNLVVIAACVALALGGSGYLSADRFIHERRTGRRAGRAPEPAVPAGV